MSLASVKVLDDRTRRCKPEQLARAIHYCIERKVRIVNLSLGSSVFRDRAILKAAVNRSYRHGTHLVAAMNNSGRVTWPASFTNVLGVRCDRSDSMAPDDYNIVSWTLDGSDVVLGGVQLLSHNEGEALCKRVIRRNSPAAAVISARVYEILRDNPNAALEDVKSALWCGCRSGDATYNPYRHSRVDWIDRAVLAVVGNTGAAVRQLPYDFAVMELIESPGTPGWVDRVCEALGRRSEADALVVYDARRRESSAADIEPLVKRLASLGQGLVYVNGKSTALPLSVGSLATDLKVRHWCAAGYTDAWRDDGTGSLEDNEIDVPVVVIRAGAEVQLLRAMRELGKLFAADDREAYLIVDSPLAGLVGMDCLGRQERGSLPKLKALLRIYAPDLIIRGIIYSKHSGAAQPKGTEVGYDIDVRLGPGVGWCETAATPPPLHGCIAIRTASSTEDQHVASEGLWKCEGSPIRAAYRHIRALLDASG